MTGHRSAWMRGAATALLLLLMAALLQQGRGWFLAGINARQSKVFVQHWAAGGHLEQRDWVLAHDSVISALQVTPGAGASLRQIASEILLWRHLHEPFGSQMAAKDRQEAVRSSRAAAVLRPDDGMHWATLARTKLYALELDEEFHAAFRRANEREPAAIGSSRILAEIGFIAWDRLGSEEKEIAVTAAGVTAGFSGRDADRVIALAESTQLIAVLCNELSVHERISRYCAGL